MRLYPTYRSFRTSPTLGGVLQLLRDWTSPEAVFQSLKRLSRGTPCDFSGISGYEMLERSGGVQWPFEGSRRPPWRTREVISCRDTERRMFEDGEFFPTGVRASWWEDPQALPEPQTSCTHTCS